MKKLTLFAVLLAQMILPLGGIDTITTYAYK